MHSHPEAVFIICVFYILCKASRFLHLSCHKGLVFPSKPTGVDFVQNRNEREWLGYEIHLSDSNNAFLY